MLSGIVQRSIVSNSCIHHIADGLNANNRADTGSDPHYLAGRCMRQLLGKRAWVGKYGSFLLPSRALGSRGRRENEPYSLEKEDQEQWDRDRV